MYKRTCFLNIITLVNILAQLAKYCENKKPQGPRTVI